MNQNNYTYYGMYADHTEVEKETWDNIRKITLGV